MLERVGLSPAEAAQAAADSAAAADRAAGIKGPPRIRHHNNFAVVGRGTMLMPLHIVREDELNINDITTTSYGWDAGVRWYVIDDFAIGVRFFSGGLAFKASEGELELFDHLADFSSASFHEFSGFEAVINAYFGDVMIPKAPINPFLTACFGKYDWTLTKSGRGSDPVMILDEEVTGSDYGIGMGLGVEYPVVSESLVLEFEWLWRYLLTQDEQRWKEIRTEWTNTHCWDLTLGIVFNF